MRLKVFAFVSVFACFMAAAAVAQEGYPLIGTWSGDWGPSAKQRTQVVVIIEWDGKIISGIINPGFPEAAQLRAGTLDSTKWTVHLEAESRDDRGNPVRIVIDGKLENIGSYNRTLSGTWIQGNIKGNFKLTRE